MITRRETLTHPKNGKVDLPLLVPSFSSKGFGFDTHRGKRPEGKTEYSEVANSLPVFTTMRSDAALISAYDYHFGHLDSPDNPPDVIANFFDGTTLTFIDSGGYELISDFDSTEPRTYGYTPKEGFGFPECAQVFRTLADSEKDLQLVLTNFDDDAAGLSFLDQVAKANQFLVQFPNQMTNFLLKPMRDSPFVDPEVISPRDYDSLKDFSILGVTEKELGDRLIDRICAIFDLRQGMDEAGLDMPIHVWGGLDPVITPLYFFAGAEIFDGVSWLRYSYRGGVASYRDSEAILSDDLSIRSTETEVTQLVNVKNLSYLKRLGDAMMQWRRSGGVDFGAFDDTVKTRLGSAYDAMKNAVPMLEG